MIPPREETETAAPTLPRSVWRSGASKLRGREGGTKKPPL